MDWRYGEIPATIGGYRVERRIGAGGMGVVLLAEALRDIHRVGLVHRDLKPANVLLTEYGPRIIDFCIARVLANDLITRSGKVLGTVSFMAPEQLTAPREVDTRSDVFALGGVPTFAATGRGPFDLGDDTPAVTVAMGIVHDEPDLSGVPAGLRPLVERCLRKDPADRPSPAELLALLRDAPSPSSPPDPPVPVLAPVPRHWTSPNARRSPSSAAARGSPSGWPAGAPACRSASPTAGSRDSTRRWRRTSRGNWDTSPSASWRCRGARWTWSSPRSRAPERARHVALSVPYITGHQDLLLRANGPSDLKGKRVCVVENSTGEERLRAFLGPPGTGPRWCRTRTSSAV
ncbi:serine/threonine-protein kinase [Streptomyces albiaxialis]|uniref:serine/threonine-protein kinase n=1 Tax=Streptomyces albiaxialis TaxID=329523 RepID=UPI003CD0A967